MASPGPRTPPPPTSRGAGPGWSACGAAPVTPVFLALSHSYFPMALPLDLRVSPTRAATCLIVCSCYCLLGGAIYSFLEPEWSFTDCIYFSFVASAEWKPC